MRAVQSSSALPALFPPIANKFKSQEQFPTPSSHIRSPLPLIKMNQVTTSTSAQSSLKKYKKIKYLGKGSYGAALLVCLRSNPNQKFVIKEIVIGHLRPAEQQAAKTEADVLHQMAHSNITMYIESFVENAKLYIVMEFADGGDLCGAVARKRDTGRKWSEAEVMRIFVQICLALKHVHQANILHRDLKSQNIFLTLKGVVKLGDFGIAKMLDASADKASTTIGTPYYLSPEICESLPYGQKSDVWSLGVVLFELCALELPFQAKSLPSLVQKICHSEPTYSKIDSHFSISLVSLIKKLLSKSPDDRPSVKEILRSSYVKSHICELLSHTLVNHTGGGEGALNNDRKGKITTPPHTPLLQQKPRVGPAVAVAQKDSTDPKLVNKEHGGVCVEERFNDEDSPGKLEDEYLRLMELEKQQDIRRELARQESERELQRKAAKEQAEKAESERKENIRRFKLEMMRKKAKEEEQWKNGVIVIETSPPPATNPANSEIYASSKLVPDPHPQRALPPISNQRKPVDMSPHHNSSKPDPLDDGEKSSELGFARQLGFDETESPLDQTENVRPEGSVDSAVNADDFVESNPSTSDLASSVREDNCNDNTVVVSAIKSHQRNSNQYPSDSIRQNDRDAIVHASSEQSIDFGNDAVDNCYEDTLPPDSPKTAFQTASSSSSSNCANEIDKDTEKYNLIARQQYLANRAAAEASKAKYSAFALSPAPPAPFEEPVVHVSSSVDNESYMYGGILDALSESEHPIGSVSENDLQQSSVHQSRHMSPQSRVAQLRRERERRKDNELAERQSQLQAAYQVNQQARLSLERKRAKHADDDDMSALSQLRIDGGTVSVPASPVRKAAVAFSIELDTVEENHGSRPTPSPAHKLGSRFNSHNKKDNIQKGHVSVNPPRSTPAPAANNKVARKPGWGPPTDLSGIMTHINKTPTIATTVNTPSEPVEADNPFSQLIDDSANVETDLHDVQELITTFRERSEKQRAAQQAAAEAFQARRGKRALQSAHFKSSVPEQSPAIDTPPIEPAESAITVTSDALTIAEEASPVTGAAIYVPVHDSASRPRTPPRSLKTVSSASSVSTTVDGGLVRKSSQGSVTPVVNSKKLADVLSSVASAVQVVSQIKVGKPSPLHRFRSVDSTDCIDKQADDKVDVPTIPPVNAMEAAADDKENDGAKTATTENIVNAATSDTSEKDILEKTLDLWFSQSSRTLEMKPVVANAVLPAISAHPSASREHAKPQQRNPAISRPAEHSKYNVKSTSPTIASKSTNSLSMRKPVPGGASPSVNKKSSGYSYSKDGRRIPIVSLKSPAVVVCSAGMNEGADASSSAASAMRGSDDFEVQIVSADIEEEDAQEGTQDSPGDISTLQCFLATELMSEDVAPVVL